MSHKFILLGPEVTVKSLIAWANFLGNPVPFDILSFIVRISRSLIVPTIVSSSAIAHYIVQHGSRICESISQAPRIDDKEKQRRVMDSFCIDMQHIIGFITVFVGNADLTASQMRQFHQGYEKQLFQFASRTVELTESIIMPAHIHPEMEGWIRNLAQYAATIYVSFSDFVDIPRPSHGSTIDRAVAISVHCTLSPPRVVLECLCRSKDTQTCFAIDCSESFQTSRQNFRRCAQCRVVAYCSKECQRRAWSDQRLPHKSICKKVKQVVEAGGKHLQLGSHEKFTRSMVREKIPDALLRDVAVWFGNMTALIASADGHSDFSLYSPEFWDLGK